MYSNCLCLIWMQNWPHFSRTWCSLCTRVQHLWQLSYKWSKHSLYNFEKTFTNFWINFIQNRLQMPKTSESFELLLINYVPLKDFSVIWTWYHCPLVRPMPCAYSAWAGRDLYRAIYARTRQARGTKEDLVSNTTNNTKQTINNFHILWTRKRQFVQDIHVISVVHVLQICGVHSDRSRKISFSNIKFTRKMTVNIWHWL